MTKKELIQLLANMPDDAQIMVWHNGTIYNIFEIEFRLILKDGRKDSLIKIKGQ